MPNKFARQVPIAEFNPKAVLPEGLAPVKRPMGEAFEETASAAAKVADAIGRYADEAAAIEGKQAGAIAGNDPNYRPSGATTLRGRAFEQEASKVYLDNLDATLRSNLQATYEAHKDDPAALKTALDGLHTKMSANDVFPEVQGHFNKTFQTLSNSYRNAALSGKQSNDDDDLRAATIKNLANVQTTVRKTIATLDPNDPAVEQAVSSGVAQATRLYGRAADLGAITQTAAVKQTQDMRNDAYGELVLRRAGNLNSADEAAAFRKTFEQDFSAGKYDGKLDGAGFDKVQANLSKMEVGLLTSGRTAARGLKSGLDDFVKREAAGLTPQPAEWTALTAAARDVPDGDRMIALASAKRSLAATLSASPIEQGDAILQRLRADARGAGGVTPEKAELITFGQKFIEEERKGLRVDQLGTAQKKGIIATVAPIDFETIAQADKPAEVEALAAQVRARGAQAEAVAQSFARQPQYFRPEEKARLAEIVNMGGDRALALAGAIVKGGGNNAPNMLAEISHDAPLLAQAGVIVAEGGSLTAARDAFQAQHIKQLTKKALPGVAPAVAAPVLRDDMGQAFILQPDDASRVRAAADAIARTRLDRAQADPKGSEAKAIYRQALQEAAGAIYVNGVQYGGIGSYKPGFWTSYKVALPSGLRADGLRDVLGAIRDEDLAGLPVPPEADGKPYRARDLYGAAPVAVKGGFRFAMGDPNSDDPRYVRGRDGKPFVLPFDELAPTLRQRVPGAFLGAR